MKRIIFIAIIVVLCCSLACVAHARKRGGGGGGGGGGGSSTNPGPPLMSNYSATPPFLVQSAAPNIMLVIDMSGSMQFPAHFPDNFSNYDGNGVAQCGSGSSGLSATYDGTKNYYGYFDSNTFYTYDSGTDTFKENGDCTDAQNNDKTQWSTSKIPGNLLNWATMSRIDILREVLIGGKSTSTYTASPQILKSEGGSWDLTDSTLHCKFSVDGADSNQSHTVTISSTTGGTCPVASSGTKNVQLQCAQEDRVGVIQEMGDAEQDGAWDTGAPRFGLMLYSGQDVGLIKDGCGTNTASGFISDLQTIVSHSSTPTGEAMTNALDYFKHTKTSTTYGGSINNNYMTSSTDPWQYSCQKSFIRLISDGEWGGGYPNAIDPMEPARLGRTGNYDAPKDSNGNATTPRDLRGNTKSGNQAVGLTGNQVVTTYDIYAFESASNGRNSLRTVAMYGGFTDKDTSGSGVDWPYPYTTDSHPTDSKTVSFPLASCPALPTTRSKPDYCLEWDEDKDGIPDNYYESQDGQAMHDAVTADIYNMMREAASGTSVSVLSTSAEGAGSLFQAYFDYKRVEGLQTVYWVGYLNALWIDQYGNIREDTNNDQALSLTDDYIIQFYVDTNVASPTYGLTLIDRYKDTKGNGVVDQSKPDHVLYQDTKQISEITPIWEGGKQLALRNDASDPRKIFTWLDVNNDGAYSSGDSWGSNIFVTSNANTLSPYLNPDTTTGTALTAANIIKFIRGQDVDGMRNRLLTIDGHEDQFWKLGDITYSTPVAVAAPASNYHIIYGDTTYHDFYTKYKNRRVVIYTGANDGMLHAFNAGFYHEGDNGGTTGTVEHGWYSDPANSTSNNANLGREQWAYIPYNLLPQLRWLADTKYSHCYYVDLKPRIVDARVFVGQDDGVNGWHPNGWGTILIGGMRLGGGNLPLYAPFNGSTNSTRVFRSAYFALDITDPERDPVLLWEYWDAADAGYSNLGFTTSYPTVARVDTSNGDYHDVGNWYVIFGSGAGTLGTGGTDTTKPWSIAGTVKDNGGNGSTYTHYLYVLDLKTGAPLLKKDMTSVDGAMSGKNAFMTDPITVDLKIDYKVDKGYIGASYNNSGWLGKMFRININNSVPSSWTFSTFMSLDRPVMAPPSAAVDLYNRLWLYQGTGRFFTAADQSNTDSQYLIGAWDSGSNTIAFPTPSNLNNVTDIHVYQNGYVYGGLGVNATLISNFADYLTARRVEYSRTPPTTMYGWYLTTTAGERFVDKPTVVGGNVLLPSFIPTTDVCGIGGSSYLYAPYYETGTAYFSGTHGFIPVLGTGSNYISVTIPGSPPQTMIYNELLNKKYLGSGMPTNAVIHAGKEQGVVSLIQMGTGVIMQLTVNPAFSPKSQTLFWEERR
jgi:type IV pilus assembly protein PilY1